MSRCEAQVHDGGRSPSFHGCMNNAQEGTEPPRCGVHMPKVLADRERPATAAASAEVTERVTVKLSWPDGQGPRWQQRYTHRVAEFAHLWLTIRRGSRPEGREQVDAVGYQVKKDGTTGQRLDARFMTWDDLPVEVREAFLDALDEHESRDA